MTKKAEAVREANEEELTVNDIMPNPLMEDWKAVCQSDEERWWSSESPSKLILNKVIVDRIMLNLLMRECSLSTLPIKREEEIGLKIADTKLQDIWSQVGNDSGSRMAISNLLLLVLLKLISKINIKWLYNVRFV